MSMPFEVPGCGPMSSWMATTISDSVSTCEKLNFPTIFCLRELR